MYLKEMVTMYPKGLRVYPVVGPDFGIAEDETSLTGKKHISVTLDPSGNVKSGAFPVAIDNIEFEEGDPDPRSL